MREDDCPPFPELQPSQLGRECAIVNKKGLHARASAKFVQLCETYDAEIFVTRCEETVGGLSIMGLMMLNASIGTSVYLRSSGNQAQEALDGLSQLIANRFGEED